MPVVGDPTYLPNRVIAGRQTLSVNDPPMCLHAFRLGFEHPATGRWFEMESPAPDWAIVPAELQKT
jgi:23S rRNA-/tRNA-specific pseudouridylate synthase